MGKKTICVNGYNYDATNGIILCLLDVSKDYGMDLSDHLFSSVVQEFEEDEEKVMDEMAVCQDPSFKRYGSGWRVESSDGDDDY